MATTYTLKGIHNHSNNIDSLDKHDYPMLFLKLSRGPILHINLRWQWMTMNDNSSKLRLRLPIALLCKPITIFTTIKILHKKRGGVPHFTCSHLLNETMPFLLHKMLSILISLEPLLSTTPYESWSGQLVIIEDKENNLFHSCKGPSYFEVTNLDVMPYSFK